MQDLCIRPLRTGDSETLAQLTAGSFLEDDARQWIAQEPEHLLAAVLGDSLVGIAYADPGADTSFISVFVAPAHRRKGIGTGLYAQAEARCKSVGASRVLSTHRGDVQATNFAEKLGFSWSFSSAFMTRTGPMLPEVALPFRLYRDADYAQCQSVFARSFHEMRLRVGFPDSKPAQPSRKDRELFSKRAQSTYVLYEGDTLVSCGVIDGGELSSVAVHADHQNRGYGRAMISMLTNEIMRRGHETVSLWCVVGNHARHLYDSLGFEEQHVAVFPQKKLESIQ